MVKHLESKGVFSLSNELSTASRGIITGYDLLCEYYQISSSLCFRTYYLITTARRFVSRMRKPSSILYLYAISAGGATAESHDSIDGPVSLPTSTWRTISNISISISVLVAGFLCTRKVGQRNKAHGSQLQTTWCFVWSHSAAAAVNAPPVQFRGLQGFRL